MSGYIGNVPTPQATQSRQSFTATASQTSFATVGYTAGFLDVYLNGVHLLDGTDYTATNGSDIVLTTGAALNDILEFVAYSTYEVNSQNYTGGLTVDNTGATVLTVDRATSDGTIIDLQKDGVSKGTIGLNSNRPYLEKAAAGGITISSSGGNPIILPTSSAGALSDNLANIGAAAYRFKDLFLSGGVYLGGTGAANYLDDYEEGTWTPDLGSGVASSSEIGIYRKIGNVVFIEGTFTVGTNTSTSQMYVSGLPFTVVNGSRGGFFIRYSNYGSVVYLHTNSLNTNFNVYSQSGAAITYGNFSGKRIDFAGQYYEA